MANALVGQTKAPVPVRTQSTGTGPLTYCIDGHPGKRFQDIDEACITAGDLVSRLRLSRAVNIRVSGTDTIAACACRDAELETVTVIRYIVG